MVRIEDLDPKKKKKALSFVYASRTTTGAFESHTDGQRALTDILPTAHTFTEGQNTDDFQSG